MHILLVMAVHNPETSGLDISLLGVAPGYIFTGLNLWPPLLIRANALQENGHASPQSDLDQIGPYSKLEFDVTKYQYKQVFYPFGRSSEFYETVKSEIKALIRTWGTTDKRLSHPEGNLEVGEVLLLVDGDPICFITDLELDHPHIFVVGSNAKYVQIHLKTILPQLPSINDNI